MYYSVKKTHSVNEFSVEQYLQIVSQSAENVFFNFIVAKLNSDDFSLKKKEKKISGEFNSSTTLASKLRFILLNI